MLRNTIKVALRTLRRHLGYTVLNVVGLGVGLAACLLMGLYVWHELTYDRFHEQADRIARVVERQATPDEVEQVAASAGPLGPALVDEVPAIEEAARLTTLFRLTVERDENRRYVGDYLFSEPALLDVFDFPVAKGNARAALREPGTVVLTDEAAQFYFGDQNPVGRTVEIEWMGSVTVGAVLGPLPERSHLQFSMIFPFVTLAKDTGFWSNYVTNWTPDSRLLTTYVTLSEGTTPESLQSDLDRFVSRHHSAGQGPQSIALQPLTDIHLHSADITGGYNDDPGRPAYVTIFSLIALFILGIAIINYVNIATARSAERAREVGVRKALGAQPGQLVIQFLGEAVVLTGAAFTLGLALARGAWPAFQSLAGISLSFDVLATPTIVTTLATGLLLVALVSGVYPAFVLTQFQPTRTLAASGTTSAGGAWPRRGLVVLQFALSIGLLVATFTVGRQLEYVQSKPLGFSEEHVVTIDINSTDVRADAETVRKEMQRHSAVRSVSVSSRVPGDWKELPNIQVAGAGMGDASRPAHYIGADDAFLDTYEISLTAGRTFDPARPTDSSSVMLNETAVQSLGLADPVGTTIQIPSAGPSAGDGTAEAGTFRVVGVVEDFHYESLHRPIQPLVIGHHKIPIDEIDYFSARVDRANVSAAIEHLRSVGETFDPVHPFEYHLLDEQIGQKYETDRRVGQLFGIAAALAVLIACIGLLGLAAFTAQRRRKEISVRKVLGATTSSIVRLLSTQYAALVGSAFVVAAPVAYVAMQWWLQEFAYHVNVSIGLLLAAGGVALAIALATVSIQALRAARIDPANTLRSE